MHLVSLGSIAVLAGLQTVSAHGWVANVVVGGVSYPAWAPYSDPYVTPEPVRYDRKILDAGPVQDFTSNNITCDNGGNIPAKGIIELTAGTKVRLQWNAWTNGTHSGPVMNYLAKCTPDCASFKGDTGTPWVKFNQMAYDTTQIPSWGSDKLATQGAWWDVTIPASLAPGEYLLRHEILALHVASTRMGAQFYPSCTQIKVTSGGTKQLPNGVALPGAYNPDDTKGVMVELWKIEAGLASYTAPGGPVQTI